MKISKIGIIIISLLTIISFPCHSANSGKKVATPKEVSLKEQAETVIAQLRSIINIADTKDICTLKEKTALRTAEIFMGYADWDEANVEKNIENFKLVSRYKNEAEKYANLLPEFERQEIIEMMNQSISDIQNIIDGKSARLYSPNIDWSDITVNKDELTYDNKPVFLADWTWKPKIDNYTEFHGNQDGYFLTVANVLNNNGEIKSKVVNELKAKEDGSLGFIFLNHKNLPAWASAQDPTIVNGQGIDYIQYDINNPLSLQIDCDLIKGTVPYMAGKKYTQLGYMLCNEPHWNCIDDTWASCAISEYAYAEFLKWLKIRHKDISTLNNIWNTNYGSFEEINIPRSMTADKRGTAAYYDFLCFNMDRVTNWFSFLQSEIKKYDAAAKTHIKLMPNLWSNNSRDSGIDMEALTRNSDIIGNDASSCGALMWGKPAEWETYYSFDWREVCMAYDFYKSVSPDKLMYNTEGHFLSTNNTRDLYMTPQYVRCNYWLATIHGLSASQTWYWCRREDGSAKESNDAKGYAASNNHQPRVVNEVHATIADLNSVSDVIMKFQRQRKPIRIFYTKASAINKTDHMTDIYHIYESINFMGDPVGFVTEGIINNNPCDWDVVLIYKTHYVTNGDVIALQKYLDNGGTIIMDNESLKTNEYGKPLTAKLSGANLYTVSDLKDYATQSFDLLNDKQIQPAIDVIQTSALSRPTCEWRVIKLSDKEYALNLVNLGKEKVKIEINDRFGQEIEYIQDILSSAIKSNTITVEPNGVEFLLIKYKLPTHGANASSNVSNISIYTANGYLHINGANVDDTVSIYNSLGVNALNSNSCQSPISLHNLSKGAYIVKVKSNNHIYSKKVIL